MGLEDVGVRVAHNALVGNLHPFVLLPHPRPPVSLDDLGLGWLAVARLRAVWVRYTGIAARFVGVRRHAPVLVEVLVVRAVVLRPQVSRHHPHQDAERDHEGEP